MTNRIRRAVTRRSLLLVGAALVLAGVAFGVVLPRIASYGAVWAAARHLPPPWLGALGAAVVVNTLTFAPPWTIALPGLGFLDALKLTQASTAMTLVAPGGATLGMAASYTMLRSLGFEPAAVGRSVAVTGIWSQLSTFLFPLVGALAVAAEGDGGASFVATAALGGALFVVAAAAVIAAFASNAATRPIRRLVLALARLVLRLRRREPASLTEGDVDRFRQQTLALLRMSWGRLTVATAANQLTGFAILDLSLRAAGIHYGSISVAESFAAWSVGRLIASLPVTPGGIGLVELGLAGTLIGFGGGHARVVVAVIVYRLLSILPTLVLGLAAIATWNGGGRTRLTDSAQGER